MSAEKNIYTHLHLRGNELRGFVFERLESDPDPIDGRIYYNVAKNEFRACISGVWVNIFSIIWHVDDDGNITTDKQVIIKNNLIVEGDTSSGGEGEDTPSTGLDETRLQEYLDEHKYVTEDDIAGLIPSNIATVAYVNTKFNSIDLSPYAKTTELNAFANRVTPIETWMDNVGQHITYDAELDAIVINHNLIVAKDTSSGGEGADTPGGSGGVSEEDMLNILEKNDYITKSQSDARYLALSGGILYNDVSDTPLYIKSDRGAAYIGFKNSSDAFLGYYGFNATTPTVYIGTSTEYNIIHSGNIGSYAMKWMGSESQRNLNTFSYDAGVFGSFYSPNAPRGLAAYAVLNLPYRRNAEKPDFMAQILIPNGNETDTNMYYRTSLADSWNPWRKVISTDDDGYIYGLGGYIDIQYSDEINRYGGNLYLQHRGNATGVGTGGNTTGHILMCANGGNVGIGTTSPEYKLDVNGKIRFEARNIWGQSFDGTGDVLAGSGVGLMSSKGYYYGLSILPTRNPYYGVRTFLTYDQGSTMGAFEIASRHIYGLTISHGGGVAYDYGNIPSNLSYQSLIHIRPNGNVLIGTEVDAGYKLDVNGDISAMSALRIGGCGASYCGLYPNSQITSNGQNSKLWLYNDYGLVLYGTSLEILTSTSISDNLTVNGFAESTYNRNSCMSSNMFFTSTQWLRIWKGPYGSAVRLQIGKNYYHMHPMVLCVDVSVGYSTAAISVTCNSDAANLAIQAIRVTNDASGNYNIDVLIYNAVVNTDTFRVCGNSGLGHILAFETADNSATVLEQISVVPNASIISNNLIVAGDVASA